ncbi:MAG: hypothetical protein J5640_03375 [Bacteroidales bacterium]|nr:hypothetical protein [Bacteroidales bacterium]
MRKNTYPRFASLLEGGSYSSYEAICRALRVCPDDLDELLLGELGCTGSELFNYYFGIQCEIY